MSIVVNSLTYIHADRERLFSDISFAVPKGRKAAIVGNNGTGKSTLMQLLAGCLPAAGGEAIAHGRTFYLPQHPGDEPLLTVAGVLGIEPQLNAYEAILNGDTSVENFTTLNDDWTLEERIQQALTYWQLGHLSLRQPLHQLSGGEKTRVFLAGMLIQEPEIILLDEPSNHLDTAGRTLLYDFVRTSKATLLVISHDRALLNLMELTVELVQGGIEVFGGNYDFYKSLKDNQLEALEARRDEKEKALKQARQKARELAEQRRKQEQRGKAHGEKQNLPKIVAGNLKSKAEVSSAKLNDTQQEKITGISDNLRDIRNRIQAQQLLKIDWRKPDIHRGKVLIEAHGIGFGYTGTPLWQAPLYFMIRSGERIRITGNNGTGKTTLLKLLAGLLKPTSGSIHRADFSFLYIDQHYSIIKPQLTVYEQVETFNSRLLPEHELRMLLVYHQFPPEAWDRKCSNLSGGERLKLLLCCLAVSHQSPELLILDEPTNNLDIHSQNVLTQAVSQFGGTLLVITHDTHFIEQINIGREIAL